MKNGNQKPLMQMIKKVLLPQFLGLILPANHERTEPSTDAPQMAHFS